MKSGLARALLKKGVIRQGTVLGAHHRLRGLSCVDNADVVTTFAVARATLSAGSDVWFDGYTSDRSKHRLRCETVISIDGMAVERIALSHNLSLDGEQLSPRKRRGRRRKECEGFAASQMPC